MDERISSPGIQWLAVSDEAIDAAYAAVLGTAPTPSEAPLIRRVVRAALAHAVPCPRPSRLHDEVDEAGGTGMRSLARSFKQGLRRGIEPFGLEDVAVAWAVGQDVMVLRLGRTALVEVCGLDMLQARDLEALGYEKGQALWWKRTHDGSG